MVEFDATAIMNLAASSKGKVKDCTYKDYVYFAMQFPAGYVYANKFWHPKSYQFLKKNSENDIMQVKDIPPDTLQQLRYEGCYITDGDMITICGQSGELYGVPWLYFKEKYTTVHESRGMGNNVRGFHDHFSSPPINWTAVTTDTSLYNGITRSLAAFYIPPSVTGCFKQRTGETVVINAPELGKNNHGSMAILPYVDNNIKSTKDVLALAQALDPSSVDILPVEVFKDRCNLRVGNWCEAPFIKKLRSKKPVSIVDVRNRYKLNSMMHTYTIVGEVNWITSDVKDSRRAIVKENYRQSFVKFAVRLQREREPELLDLLRNFRKLTVGVTSHEEVVKLIRSRLNTDVMLLHSEDLKALRRVYVTCGGRVWMVAGSAVYDRFMELDVNQYVNYGAIFKKDIHNAWHVTCLTGAANLV